MNLKAVWTTFKASWKTTVSGFLSFIAVTSTVLSGFTLNSNNPTLAKWYGGIAIAGGLAKAYIGILQKDADKVIAKVPGIAEVEAVDAHPVPDNPKAKVQK